MFNDKLQMRPVMRESYLIQRLHKPMGWKVGGVDVDNPFAFGGGLINGGLSKDAMGLLRKILSFDYMGSSEFEWGAVPAALQFLADNASKKNLATGSLNSIYYIAPKEYETEVKKRIALLSENEYAWQKKEYCGLHDKLTDGSDYHQRNVGWLELDNGYAFFVDREMYEAFCSLFEITAVPAVEFKAPQEPKSKSESKRIAIQKEAKTKKPKAKK